MVDVIGAEETCGTKVAADLVIVNAQVVTVDRGFSIKEAVAARDGRIVFVGRNAAARRFIGAGTRTIDLRGKPLLPGINDTHAHVDSLGSSRPPLAIDLNYPNVQSIGDIAASTAAKIATLPAGKWVRGGGWNPAFLAECKADPRREPTKRDLDPVSPGHPVILTDFSHHNAVVNSRALQMAGVTSDTPDPPGGIIVRDGNGEPSGVLRESAVFMMEAFVPPTKGEELKAAILAGMREMNLHGITSYTQPLFSPYEEQVAVYRELHRRGLLTARVTGMLAFGASFETFRASLDRWEAPRDLDSDWLQFSQAKIFADGIPQTKTAWMWEPYVGGGHGSLTIAAADDEAGYENLLQMIRYGHEKGWQIGVHAVGDRAICAVLDGYESAGKLHPMRKDMRHYIIHDEMITRPDIDRSARLGVAASMQPLIHRLLADGVAALFGPERAERDWPFRSVREAGARLTFSSDAPVVSPDWRQGVQAAMLREGFSGVVNGPGECISRQDAIRAYTIDGAWLDHKDRVKGSIEKGKVADFCVLADDILAVDGHDIGKIPVMMTIVGGKIVYDVSEGAFG